MIKYKFTAPPGKVADALVMEVSFNGTPFLVNCHTSFLLLTKHGTKRIFLREVADQSASLLEEDLELPAGDLSNPVDLLD